MHPSFSPSYRPRGGYRQLGSSSLYFNDGSKIPGARIDARPRAARMMGGDEGPLAPRGNQFLPNRPKTRQDNIDAARADGTFDAKRAAFNAANKGSYMDERGKIGPKAPSAATPASTAPTSTTQTGASQEPPQKPSAPKISMMGQAQSMREAGAPIPGQDRWGRTKDSPSAKGLPASAFNQTNPSSSARGEWQAGGPSRSYGTASVQPFTAQSSLKGATFEGKSRAEWFGAAAQRQKQGNAFSNEALAQAKPGQAPTYAPGSVEARAQALGNAMKTAQQGNQIVANLPKAAPAPVAAAPKTTAPAQAKPAPAPVAAKAPATPAAPSSNASWFSSASKSLTQGAQTMMNDRAAKEAKLAEAEQRAKPGMEKVADVAKGASVGAFTAATTPAKAIATPVQATIAGAQEAGRKIGETVNKAVQGVKTFMQGDQSAAQEAAKLKAELNPPPAPSIAGDEEKKKRVATR